MSLLQLQIPSLNPIFSHSPQSLLNPSPNSPLLLSPPQFSKPTPKPLRLRSFAAAASNPNPKPRRRTRSKSQPPQETNENSDEVFPKTIPRKPRRGRRSEAAAIEDLVRNSLERTFTSIREQNSRVSGEKDDILKRKCDEGGSGSKSDGEKPGSRKEVVEDDDPNWPVDSDVGWGIRASDYFEQYPIKNLLEEGMEIDWEGELDDNWVKEINILEWERFAFHPSPLIVLGFERYKRAVDNWKLLKELEKAIQVYWNAKDRLPPRTVKFDVNIEKDLAYALKVYECPELLFIRGNKILYREKELRTADELVQMIAHFYYNAKRPSWIDASSVAPPHY